MSPNDPDTVSQIETARAKGPWATMATYLKLSGPGWLQSAITLGGGSLAGALFLGVVGGYSMLWVQVSAMIMGVIMLCAISYVTLSTPQSPFQGMREHINPVLAWGWIIATLAANMVWSLPQFSLAYGAITENIAGGAVDNAESLSLKLIISFILLAIVVRVTFFYGSKGVGIRIYETILKGIVGVIVLSFVVVALKLAFSQDGLPLGEILSGYIPNPALFFRPADTYQAALALVPDEAARAFWTSVVLEKQRAVIIGAASAAVGINMTFLLPYSMRAKGWGPKHRGLAIFDLSTGMVIPFLIATSCIVIVSGHLFHGQPYEDALVEENGIVAITSDPSLAPQAAEIGRMLDQRAAVASEPTDPNELRIAAMVLNRSNQQFATSLESLVGPTLSHFIFGIGVLAMALSTISILMLISGFVVCEMFGYPHGGIQHKLGTLLASTGVLWPFLWTGSSRAYLAIPTSVFGYTLLPVAFLAFFLMMNSSKLLGDRRPRGLSRAVWNILMGVSLLVTGLAAVSTAWQAKLSIAGQVLPFGKVFIIGFAIAIVAGHFYLRRKRA